MKRMFLFASMILLGGGLAGCMSIPSQKGGESSGAIITGTIHIPSTGTATGGVMPPITGSTTGIDTGSHTTITAHYTVNLASDQPGLMFTLMSGDTIILSIAQPSSKTFVRVRQVISPDGAADGPFESRLQYTASQQGAYRFLIGPNLMASEVPCTGSVDVTVTLPH